MINSAIPPIHPGEILKEEFLDELDITPYKLAKNLNVPSNRITQIINGQRDITADTALRLSRFFGNSAEFWLNLQSSYNLKSLKLDLPSEIEDIEPMRKLA